MKFEDRIYRFISERQLIASDDKVLLGVSGGADSVCLFRVLLSLCEKFHLCESLTVVHVNHMIRGAEADADQKFVETLCERYNVKCYSYRRDIPALSRKFGMSEEETGRKVRYELFDEVSSLEGCSKIAVAHHKNDLAETVIFNMTRGSGLSGLCGILSARDNIIRPLLCVNRHEVELYLEELEQDFRTDSTNDVLDYTRNKIRHTVIPALEELNSEALDHIASLAMDAEDTDRFVGKNAEEIFNKAKLRVCMNKAFAENNTRIYLDITILQQADSVVLYKLIHNTLIKVAGRKKDITRRHIEAVVSLISRDTGKSLMLPYDIVARRSYDKLIIEQCVIKKKEDCHVTYDEVMIEADRLDEASTVSVPVPFLTEVSDVRLKNHDEGKSCIPPRMEFKLIKQPYGGEIFEEKNLYTKIFSYDKILAKNATKFCIRTCCKGDYIVIDSEGRTKSINRVFIDAKTDRADREVWPLLALDDEILWTVGLRYNEAYRVTGDTKRILKVTYINSD